MKSTLVLAILAIGLLAVPASGAAQTATEVTLKVPVNLLQFGPDVSKIRVACSIRSDAITTGNTFREVSKTTEIPMSGGQVVTTATIVFAFTGLDNPVGKSATIVCSLDGWSTSQQSWNQFRGGATNPSFKVLSTPNPATLVFLDGSFVW